MHAAQWPARSAQSFVDLDWVIEVGIGNSTTNEKEAAGDEITLPIDNKRGFELWCAR
ncbi:MAG: hypothetical protein ACI9NQ_001929 [Paracoccaceae bacterium]|jgi:hypothetical protein